MMLPMALAKSASASIALSNATPILFPNAIFATAAAMPFESSAYAATITLSAISLAMPLYSSMTFA